MDIILILLFIVENGMMTIKVGNMSIQDLIGRIGNYVD